MEHRTSEHNTSPQKEVFEGNRQGLDNDYLVYGIDEQWLRSNPYICCMNAVDFYHRYHNDVLIIHAHPFRDGNTIVFENAVHGTEIFNANPRHNDCVPLAKRLYDKHPEWYCTVASDAHRPGDEACAGLILPYRVKDSYEFKEIIESRNYDLWAPGFVDELGKKIK